MVPSHISIKNLSQILLRAGIALTAKHNKKEISSETVEEVFIEYTKDLKVSERSNNILDLEFDIDKVHTSKEEAATQAEQDAVDIAQRIQSQYAPVNGFFDQFEKNFSDDWAVFCHQYLVHNLAHLDLTKNACQIVPQIND